MFKSVFYLLLLLLTCTYALTHAPHHSAIAWSHHRATSCRFVFSCPFARCRNLPNSIAYSNTTPIALAILRCCCGRADHPDHLREPFKLSSSQRLRQHVSCVVRRRHYVHLGLAFRDQVSCVVELPRDVTCTPRVRRARRHREHRCVVHTDRHFCIQSWDLVDLVPQRRAFHR